MKFETSWDDGTKTDLEIASLLVKYKLPGTFYIIVDRVDTSGYLTWQDIKDLDSHGFEIGSHTMSHPMDLKAIYHEQLEHEIKNSKGMLESVLGHAVNSFCYPRGRYDQGVIDWVSEAGYLEGRTTKVLRDKVDYKFEKHTTIHVFQRKEYNGRLWENLARTYFDQALKKDKYFHIWGHSQEVIKHDQLGKLEEFFKYVEGSFTK